MLEELCYSKPVIILQITWLTLLSSYSPQGEYTEEGYSESTHKSSSDTKKIKYSDIKKTKSHN